MADKVWMDAVEEGKEIVARQVKAENDNWRLGELAHSVETKGTYGKETMKEYAKAIEMNYHSLLLCRSTYRAWKDAPKNKRPRLFSIATALNAHPDRHRIIEKKPDITQKGAREITKEWRQSQKPELTLDKVVGKTILWLEHQLLDKEGDFNQKILTITSNVDELWEEDRRKLFHILGKVISHFTKVQKEFTPPGMKDVKSGQLKQIGVRPLRSGPALT